MLIDLTERKIRRRQTTKIKTKRIYRTFKRTMEPLGKKWINLKDY